MREIFNMIIVLSAICGISGFSLSYLKESTGPLIEAQVLANVQGPAIRQIYPAAQNSPVEDRKAFEADGKKVMVFPYRAGGALKGVAIEGAGVGFGGDLGVMVGFNVANDTLLGIGITQMKETPGLGTKVGEPKFTKQFVGAGVDVELRSKGGVIDAISGSTVSSLGAVGAVQDASGRYKALKQQILDTWGSAE